MPALVSPVLVTVDPGLNACGVAVFLNGTLVSAWAERADANAEGVARWRSMSEGLWDRVCGENRDTLGGTLVVETMMVYPDRPVPVVDLIRLSEVVGAVVGGAPVGWSCRGVDTPTWNGQVPAAVRRERTKEWVDSMGWSSRVDLKTTARFQQDVWSAIGIGRFILSGRR